MQTIIDYNCINNGNLDDERYNDPSENDDYSSYEEDTWGGQHEVDCQSCSGTGENCVWCGGKGYKIIKH